jgi:hypothetical protein
VLTCGEYLNELVIVEIRPKVYFSYGRVSQTHAGHVFSSVCFRLGSLEEQTVKKKVGCVVNVTFSYLRNLIEIRYRDQQTKPLRELRSLLHLQCAGTTEVLLK